MERIHAYKQCLRAVVVEWPVVSRASRPRIAGKMPATPHPSWRRLWIVVALTALSTIGGVGFSQIQPSGRKAGLTQFDVSSEVNLDGTRSGNIVVFARYWVCEDYYAVSVVWTEPRGSGVNMKTAIVFSDGTGFRMDNELFPDQVKTNTTYPKPLGERGPFRWGGGFYGGSEMRFAEAEALARRVYVSDLGPAKSPKSGAGGAIDVNVPKGPGGIARKLAHLKVHAKDDRIESMELFDNQQRSLAKMKYEYERDASSPRIATLIAELPVRPEKLATAANATVTSGEETKTYRVPDANYVSHKGGRTCTVTYRDVTIGDKVLRLPVQVKVQRSDSKQLVRSAKLMNFKRVDLDKAGVWKAAKAFGSLGDEYPTWVRLVDKFLEFEPRLGPPRVDPNDLAFVRRLVAKYPLPQVVRPPREQRFKPRERTPPPARVTVEPNDVRLIRQLHAYYDKILSPRLTEEQKTQLRTKGGEVQYSIPESQREVKELRDKLRRILAYHRVAPLPEDRPPEPNEADLKLIRQLKRQYEKLSQQQDRGLGGQLKALHALSRLDLMAKDYDAFEGHATRYLQMLRDAGLNEMYMAGGYRHIESLVAAGQSEKADRLLWEWADRSAAVNDADGVYRFCGSDLGGGGDPWAGVQVLDHFLKKPGLSPVQRYEGLALRAISLDKIDKLLADPNADDDESRVAQARWVLKTATRAEIAKMVEQAVRQAVSAWGALGPARLAEAKPHSTENMSARQQNMMEAPDATRLQETSARLDQIVRQRTGQQRATPRPGKARPSGTPR